MTNDQRSMSNDQSQPTHWRRTITVIVLIAVIASAAVSSVVLVDETELVIVERLGHISAVYDRPTDRGLHFKWPWPVGTARRFDARVQLFDPPGREIFTRDKKNVTVETFVCWRIGQSESKQSVVTFFRSLGSHEAAAARLESRLRSIVATRVGQLELSNLLRVDDPEAGPAANQAGVLEDLSREIREQLQQGRADGEPLLERLGIEIVDARVKRINFPLGNQQAVFERMKSERQKIADRYRSAGLAASTVIRSHADRQHAELLAKADGDAERIRGEAEAEATSILNQAHAADPEFYRTMRTLDAYRTILNDKTTLVLSASSSLLKMLSEGVPGDAKPGELKPAANATTAP
ncbi:protein HflC [Planctomycetia bacterium]|nr:protein HflC [Planctomycetia bacterium]